MSFYSGFSLKGEEEIFDSFLDRGDLSVSGFSLGAIEAFEYVLNTKDRVDKLQLFSPAFFEDKEKKFKRLQLMFFKKDSDAYIENFLKNIALPSLYDMSKYLQKGSYEELEKLLYYIWDKDKLQELKDRNIQIEVYLGEKDHIINSTLAKEFFIEFATIYFIKNSGHILKIGE